MSYEKISQLKHVTKKLESGGMVLILNTGAVIDQEAEAMLQALHSRSTGGIQNHLKILAEKGAGKFMSSFYVGYGHKSIGDCGTATVFIEGISMLAAKAIQDWPLYSGQEASTRYVDFSKQMFIDPINTKESDNILEEWRTFYLKAQKPVQKHLEEKNPRQKDEDEKIYKKAIAARAFDITRGFLPAGASTNIAWHSNLRQLADKIAILRHHPLEEVKEIAEKIQRGLQEAFPNSFGHKLYKETENYNTFWIKRENYFTQKDPKDFKMIRTNVDTNALEKNREILEKRPPKTELPKYLAECGTVQFDFLLDFGSFRDIQRHRAVIQRMPLLTQEHGFAPWYLSELPNNIRKEAELLLKKQTEKIAQLGTTPEIAQYYIAMGYQLPNRVTGNLPALIYLIELRATRFVHPTLRVRAEQMAEVLKKEYSKYGLKIHLDPDPGRFDIKRGEHDIELK